MQFLYVFYIYILVLFQTVEYIVYTYIIYTHLDRVCIANFDFEFILLAIASVIYH